MVMCQTPGILSEKNQMFIFYTAWFVSLFSIRT